MEGPIELKDPDGYENGLIVSGGALLQQFIMSCIAMQCCAVLCCVVLCCAVLCCAVLCYSILVFSELSGATPVNCVCIVSLLVMSPETYLIRFCFQVNDFF